MVGAVALLCLGMPGDAAAALPFFMATAAAALVALALVAWAARRSRQLQAEMASWRAPPEPGRTLSAWVRPDGVQVWVQHSDERWGVALLGAFGALIVGAGATGPWAAESGSGIFAAVTVFLIGVLMLVRFGWALLDVTWLALESEHAVHTQITGLFTMPPERFDRRLVRRLVLTQHGNGSDLVSWKLLVEARRKIEVYEGVEEEVARGLLATLREWAGVEVDVEFD